MKKYKLYRSILEWLIYNSSPLSKHIPHELLIQEVTASFGCPTAGHVKFFGLIVVCISRTKAICRSYGNMEWCCNIVIHLQKRLSVDECVAYAEWLPICSESRHIISKFRDFPLDSIENARFLALS